MWRRRAFAATVAFVAAMTGTAVALPATTVDGPATTQQPAVRLRQPISGSEPLCSGRPAVDDWVSTTVRLHQFDGNTADDPVVEITDAVTGGKKYVNDQFITSASCDVLIFPDDHSYTSQNERTEGFGLVYLDTGTYEFVPTEYEYGEIFPTIWGFVEVVESDGVVDVLDIFDVEDDLISSFDVPPGYRVGDVSLDGYSIALVPSDPTLQGPVDLTHRDPLLVMHAERDAPFVISECLALDSSAEFSPSGNVIQFDSPCGVVPDEWVPPGPHPYPFPSRRVHVVDAWTGEGEVIEMPDSAGIERRLFTDDHIVLCGDGVYEWTIGTPATVVQQPTGTFSEGWMCASVR